jgi:hypothetical protein
MAAALKNRVLASKKDCKAKWWEKNRENDQKNPICTMNIKANGKCWIEAPAPFSVA